MWDELKEKQRPLVLYGTGNAAEKILKELDIRGIRVSGIFASDGFVRDRSFAGYKVLSYRDACERFGSIPKGAFLFILKHDGGETNRGYRDGLGNASHIGLYTGRGQGAMHSSSSRGCVCESTFAGKTIRNGGWNTVPRRT